MVLRGRNIVCLFFVFIGLFAWLIGCLYFGGGRESAKTDSKNPHFQNEAKCRTFLVTMGFICMRMKYRFHIKSWALNLVLIQRPGGTRKWSVSMSVQFFYACQSQGPVAWKFRLKAVVFTFKIEVSKLILQITQNKVPIASLSRKVPLYQVV